LVVCIGLLARLDVIGFVRDGGREQPEMNASTLLAAAD